MAIANIHLTERPQFYSEANLLTEEVRICCQHPQQIRVEGITEEALGKMMYHFCSPLVPKVPETVQLLEDLKTGCYSFLWDPEGNFAGDHMDRRTNEVENHPTDDAEWIAQSRRPLQRDLKNFEKQSTNAKQSTTRNRARPCGSDNSRLYQVEGPQYINQQAHAPDRANHKPTDFARRPHGRRGSLSRCNSVTAASLAFSPTPENPTP
jgi:hypothetical protein